MTKYIIVTGGVLSGLGKGISSSSIGRLLISRGLTVSAIKIDPYLNCDAGTMSPFQHGEVFVLNDGGEVDLDLGNYERFLDISLSSDHNITTGKVYKTVIEKERRGDYLGKTVQIIPHITDEIKNRIKRVSRKAGADIMLIELGGTVGDIESMPFLEAARQLAIEVGHESCIFVHTTLVPVMGVVGEQKTKPTQHSVKELRAIGIRPDVIIGRSEKALSKSIKQKIAMFCDVPERAVISAKDAKSIYQVPTLLEEQGLTDYLLERMGFRLTGQQDLTEWKGFVSRIMKAKRNVNIAIVGKYTHLKDSYISHIEALSHCAAATKTRINIIWVEGDDLVKEKYQKKLDKVHGIIVPGGFGGRGTEGKIKAVEIARTRGIPFLGVCLGFQMCVAEYCRNVMGLLEANSTEFEPDTPNPVIDLLPEQKDVKDLGGTMRLGGHFLTVKKGSKAHAVYGLEKIDERHRHRYEVNPEYIQKIEEAGLIFSGKSMDGTRMEIAELPSEKHPYFLASQFHPEFKSRPLSPSPLHLGLVKAAIEYAKNK